MKIPPSLLILLFSYSSSAQLPSSLIQLKQHVAIKGDSLPAGQGIYDAKGLHYLIPVYRWVKNTGEQVQMMKPEQYSALCRDLAFAGDYTSAPGIGRLRYDSMPKEGYDDAHHYVDTMKSVMFRPAANYILNRAAGEQVIMFNESARQPMHRIFLMTLLRPLYEAGFRYLAMEMLQNRGVRSITEMDMRAGFLAAEPNAGELIRNALALGFQVIPYEDTAAHKHTTLGRDIIRANQLATIIKKDSGARIVVLAGGVQVSENKLNEDFVPLAAAFRQQTGIDPFTIDQTELSPGSTFEYGRVFYSELQSSRKFKEPVIAFRNNLPVSLLENDMYDIQVIHPAQELKYNRPTWLSANGKRLATAVRPTEKMLYFVQAYYANEMETRSLPLLVPADQTYVTGSDGYYWLYLSPAKYKLVLRDINYAILSVKDLDVTPL
ncbi:hypothetical protein [Flavihumibacter solisilvae]|uniref:Uncharacterized protein n=1 Tax=Flavihumibacter solisilvae TaxID=1349421 RepID=A0A0C1ITK0_9BACT|nr:hypothetical protein [Flavihumibacter solisilvae]KIC93779.1 hypothetical protein OI18_15535 [Flavihumibacter solisilvae]